ncbi:hypothetical protein D3C78_1293440 [compost metagenome]
MRYHLGVVDQDVEAAEVLRGLLYQLLRLVFVGQVGAQEHGVGAEQAQGGDHLLTLFFRAPVDHHFCTLAGEAPSNALTEPLGGTSDEGNLAAESIHLIFRYHRYT